MALYNMPEGAHLPGERGYMPRVELCEVCEREAERDRDTGKWFSDDHEVVPTWVGKAFLCSAACQSQHMFNIGTDKDRELLCSLARFCNTWSEAGIRPENHEWTVQHMHTGLAVDRHLLMGINQDVMNLMKSLAGDDDYPTWYAAAIGELKADVQCVQDGLGLTDGESFGPAPLLLFGGRK